MRVFSSFFFLILLLCAIARAQHPHAEALDAEGAEEAEDEAEDEEDKLKQQEPILLEASELGEHEHRRELKRSPGPTPAPCTGTLSEDGAALCTFFDTLSASAQDQLISAGWTCDTLPADPCAEPGFRGVKCSGGRVSSLTVPPLRSGFEKFGPFVLVTEIGNLGCLKTLSLKGGNFVGSVPSELGALSLLSSLDLSNNAFSQDIPSQLASLTRLVKFDIFKNSLESSLPSDLCASKVLKAHPQSPEATLCQKCPKGQPGGGLPTCPPT